MTQGLLSKSMLVLAAIAAIIAKVVLAAESTLPVELPSFFAHVATPGFQLQSDLATFALLNQNATDPDLLRETLLHLTNEDEPHAALALEFCQSHSRLCSGAFSDASGVAQIQTVYALHRGHLVHRFKLSGIPLFSDVFCDASLSGALSQSIISGPIAKVSGFVLESKESCADCAPCVVIVSQAEQKLLVVDKELPTNFRIVLSSISPTLRAAIQAAALVATDAFFKASKGRFKLRFAIDEGTLKIAVNPFTSLENVLANTDTTNNPAAPDIVVSPVIKNQGPDYLRDGGRLAGFVANIGAKGAWLVWESPDKDQLANLLSALVLHNLGLRPPRNYPGDYALGNWLNFACSKRALGWLSDFYVFNEFQSSATVDLEAQFLLDPVKVAAVLEGTKIKSTSALFIPFPLGLLSIETLRDKIVIFMLYSFSDSAASMVNFPKETSWLATLSKGSTYRTGPISIQYQVSVADSLRVTVTRDKIQCAPEECKFPSPLLGLKNR